MNQTIYAPNTVPTANIAVNKSRLKVYKNVGNLPTYYLQKGQEFQIELANPTTSVVLAKIILNGKAISQGGLVLNPGQRVYLDRYLDIAKKFLFDTYEVSNSAEMKKAIADNGDIKVEFYREMVPLVLPDYTYRPHIYYNSNPNLGNYNIGTPIDCLRSRGTGSFPLTGTLTTTGGVGTTTTIANTSSNTTLGLNSVNTSYSSNIAGSPVMDSLNDETLSMPKKRLRTASFSKKSIETGRVEQGSNSDQTFKYVNKSFEYFAFHTVEYKMLPVSQKINTAEDINVKRYCTHCGTKVGKTDNFCSHCGKKA